MAANLMPTDRLSTVDEHVERIVESLDPLHPYDQPLLEALGLPVCENITAPMDLPAFDNSAMDGYAVYFDDVVTASEDHPVHLPVVGEMAAGQTKLFALSPGTTVRIMTGAPVPQGADAIVPVEWTDGGVASVRITKAPQLDQHVRHKGEDVQVGDVLLEDGSILGPRQLGLLASVGRSQVRSRPRPRIVIMSTGAELREPGTALPVRPAPSPTGSASSPTTPATSATRCPTSWSAPTSWSPAVVSPRAPTTWSRRCCPSSAPSPSARSRCSRASRRASGSSARTPRRS